MSNNSTRNVFELVQRGDDEAAAIIFNRYVERLVLLARSNLSSKMRQKVDAEDVVQSAFRSFFIRAREGRFAIERSVELWGLLAAITRNKLLKTVERYRQQKRHIDAERPLAGLDADSGNEPTEEEAIALIDEVELLMQGISPLQQQMLELRLQGRSIAEIAESVERSERSVRRFLGDFRQSLENRLESLDRD